ncbi:MAG TPA: DUF2092 domain-containing protein [Candidatus Competibacteraceae bacterium]|nr:DUF2092 domain-containing protein [Candidatus Competibacteraceae bacterium]HRZ06149.1 DUF2092 domain-containing protein [Candidatus Competibacteraceae bacterium]HSA48143.1 DUF2092 domain-containing protein [Candidatus Competibacteraceae bacterium]
MKMLSLLSAMLFPALALLGCASPPTDPTTASVAPPAQVISPSPAVRPQPADVLKKMAGYLRSLDRFTVRVERTTELILPTNQRLHADQTLEVALQKPNRLRVNYQNLSGGRQLFYDGTNFSLYTPEANVYASAAAAPTIDETLDLLATQYRISLPVADLLVANPDSRLAQNLTSATYVGRILIQGVPCHHLAFQTPEVDWEIWIEDGPQPLPRRLLLTDKSVEGSPQMMANLTRWDLAPTFPADFFTFKPPQNAQKITFLEQVRAVSPAKAAQ